MRVVEGVATVADVDDFVEHLGAIGEEFDCGEVLGLQPRFRAVPADVLDPDRRVREGREAQRRPQHLPAAVAPVDDPRFVRHGRRFDAGVPEPRSRQYR